MATGVRYHRQARIGGCVNHDAQAYVAQCDAALALAKRLRSTKRWQTVRLWVLAEGPMCADPYGHHVRFGETVLAAEVDHIIGLALRPDLAFERENLMPLCRGCHGEKSAGEKKARS
jgi:5-methylcytosine-specific restriction endonuclease McrA